MSVTANRAIAPGMPAGVPEPANERGTIGRHFRETDGRHRFRRSAAVGVRRTDVHGGRQQHGHDRLQHCFRHRLRSAGRATGWGRQPRSPAPTTNFLNRAAVPAYDTLSRSNSMTRVS